MAGIRYNLGTSPSSKRPNTASRLSRRTNLSFRVKSLYLVLGETEEHSALNFRMYLNAIEEGKKMQEALDEWNQRGLSG